MMAPGSRRKSRLAIIVGITLAKRQLQEFVNVRIHRRDRLGKILLVVAHVVPISRRVLGLRIYLPIDQRDRVIKAALNRVVRHAEVGDAGAAIWMVTGDFPHDRTPPNMSDPDRAFSPD